MDESLAARLEAVCRIRGEFRLRSGQVSEEYFDKYLFESQPALLLEVAQAMAPLLPDCHVLAGMELGGIPIATVLSQLTGLPTAFVRKRAKGYGTNRVVEGAQVEGRRVVVIEDVVTTGGAILSSAAHLRAAHGIVDTVLCAVDREQGGVEALASAGLQLRAVLTRTAMDDPRC